AFRIVHAEAVENGKARQGLRVEVENDRVLVELVDFAGNSGKAGGFALDNGDHDSVGQDPLHEGLPNPLQALDTQKHFVEIGLENVRTDLQVRLGNDFVFFDTLQA